MCVHFFIFHQVKLASLREYLLSMRGQGYSLVGVEQTAQSKCITKYQFQRKTVLVLGCVCTFYMNCHIWCGYNNRDLHIGNCIIKKKPEQCMSSHHCEIWAVDYFFYHEVKLHLLQDESCALQCRLFSAVCTVYDLSYAP